VFKTKMFPWAGVGPVELPYSAIPFKDTLDRLYRNASDRTNAVLRQSQRASVARQLHEIDRSRLASTVIRFSITPWRAIRPIRQPPESVSSKLLSA
jgi:hypothetical protein